MYGYKNNEAAHRAKQPAGRWGAPTGDLGGGWETRTLRVDGVIFPRVFFYISYPKLSTRVGKGEPKQGRKNWSGFVRAFIYFDHVSTLFYYDSIKPGVCRGDGDVAGRGGRVTGTGCMSLSSPHGFSLWLIPGSWFLAETALFFLGVGFCPCLSSSFFFFTLNVGPVLTYSMILNGGIIMYENLYQ